MSYSLYLERTHEIATHPKNVEIKKESVVCVNVLDFDEWKLENSIEYCLYAVRSSSNSRPDIRHVSFIPRSGDLSTFSFVSERREKTDTKKTKKKKKVKNNDQIIVVRANN